MASVWGVGVGAEELGFEWAGGGPGGARKNRASLSHLQNNRSCIDLIKLPVGLRFYYGYVI